MKRIDVCFEARHVYLSTVSSLHFVSGMKHRTECAGGGLQFFRTEESPFEDVLPDLAASYVIDVLLCLRASVRVRSRHEGVSMFRFWRTGPLYLGRDLGSVSGGGDP